MILWEPDFARIMSQYRPGAQCEVIMKGNTHCTKPPYLINDKEVIGNPRLFCEDHALFRITVEENRRRRRDDPVGT